MFDYKNYKIFSEFDEQLVNNVKLFYANKHILLFVSTDNSVYQYNIPDKQLKKFEPFSENQFIIKFECSDDKLNPHFIALTDNGRVYSWGDNNFGQLGNGTENDCNEPKLIDSLSEEFVTDICCGLKHTLVLTRTGDVFAFGINVFGECDTGRGVYHQLVPVRLDILNVIAISCGFVHSIALTQNGDVYGWGWNSYGQLGIEGTGKQWIPKQLSVVSIRQIMCGFLFTLMLSSDNDIYFCGRIVNCLLHRRPAKISGLTKFIKIASSIHSDLCVALSDANQCYIFGKFGDSVIHVFKKTEFASVHETFAFYEQITCATIKTNASKHKNYFVELSAIGMGAFSTVFKCESKADNRLYAIKKMCFKSEKRQTVYNELRILSQLDPNFVVRYIDSWVEENYYVGSYDRENAQNISSDNLLYSPNLPYLLHIQMELCAITLRDAINAIIKQCLEPKFNTLSLIGYYISIELFVELLESVQYLHSQNPSIIHRDLKPENILIKIVVIIGL